MRFTVKPGENDREFHAKWKCRFTKTWRVLGWSYNWEVVGALGGAHLHIEEYWDAKGKLQHQAGLEAHFIRPPESRAGEAPNYLECPVVKGWCWHDGTSIYPMDHLLPEFLNDATDDVLFRRVADWAERVFEDGYASIVTHVLAHAKEARDGGAR